MYLGVIEKSTVSGLRRHKELEGTSAIPDSIVDVTVNGILDNLDPHSIYIPKSELQQATDNLKGDFVGIGLSYYTATTPEDYITQVPNRSSL